MDTNQSLLTQQQLQWQSYRAFNITIVCSFIFFYSIGIIQSYSLFSTPAIFTIPILIPSFILILCSILLYCIVKQHDKLTHRIAPIVTFLMTLFITINSHFQEQTDLNSFLYLVLLLPLFYSYLLAYNTQHLIVNNVFLLLCYIFASITGSTDPLVFLFNSAFLIILCYLTIYTQCQVDHLQQPTSLHEIEKHTIMSKKNSRYLNSIIHDIRQPLSSLSLYSHLLEKKLTDTQHLQLAQSIKHSSEELERWISSLLDLARLDSNAVAPTNTEFSLTSVLSPIVQKYQQQAELKGITLATHFPDISIKGDIRLITSIVDTLLSNAVIHGSQEKDARILLAVRHYKERAILQVWNQGHAIEASIFEALFDEVVLAENPLNNKSKGIGLGLAIAQRKAQLCDTSIEAITNDKGSRFSITLKTTAEKATRKGLNELSNQCLDCHILLIDDDPSILTALSMLLENWGYQVDCADTAEKGIEHYQANKYSLVISDYRLPNQKTGLDVLKAIDKGVPSILLTGEADPEKLKEVKESNKVLDYMILNKPVKPAALRSMLKLLL